MTEGITILPERRTECGRCGREIISTALSETGWRHVDLMGWCDGKFGVVEASP